MALALVVALMVFAACAGLIAYAAVTVDEITAAREQRLMERAVARGLGRLKDDVASVAIWSDAYDRTARRFDPAWAQVNYGTYFHQYLHHDVSVVLDARDQPLAAWVSGQAVDPKSIADIVAAARPLTRAARRDADAKLVRSPSALAFNRVGAAQAAVRVGGRVFLLSASTVVPEPEYTDPLLARPDPVIVSAIEADAEYLSSLDKDYGLKHAVLLPAAAVARFAVPIRDADGTPVASLAWSPEQPGLGVYRNAAGWIFALALLLVVGVGLIVLRLRHMTQKMEDARAHAEAGDRAKADFIANMSHEIRTPLNGVLGMAQALESYELGEAPRACVKVIRDSGAALLGVLNDVLDLSKIEAGKLDIVEAEFRPEELAQRVFATFAELAAAKDLALNLRCEPDASGTWIGDAMRIRQVLANLVSNAIKFTDCGSVTVSLETDGTGLGFVVSDTGIGLGDEHLPRLFQKFEQADASSTRRHGGTGLGLAICRELVDLMGGRIEVASRRGEGATFKVSLPLMRATTAPPPATPIESAEVSAPTGALRILAAEDNPTNQLVLRALLGPVDAQLTLVADGRQAVAAFCAGAFDLILMDVQMPEMNGLEATRAIRAWEAAHATRRTPILALTANVMTHQVEAYLEAGMDTYVAKPVDAAAFYAAVDAVLAQSESPRAAA